MKQCPVCKTNYTDDSLSFCLSDGNPLEFVSDGQITQIKPFGNERMQIDFGNSIPEATSKITSVENQLPKPKSKTIFIIFALGFLFLLIAAGAVAAYFLIHRDNGKTDNTAVMQTPSSTPVQSNDSDDLKKKVANLEKQLADQKKTPTPVASPVNSPTPNSPGTATARVSQTNDGFLSLRTEPSAKTGTQLLKIPSGTTVNLQDCQKTYIVVDSHRGRWCMVSYNDQTGWVFDAWLIY